MLNCHIVIKTKFNNVIIQQFNNRGFTLVELLVVIAMVGVMTSFLLLFINPFKQLEKARDAQRQQNLKQINNALDTYYNDNNCYPLSLSFGSSWQQGLAVYMKQIPQDPSCTTGGSCYTYVADPSNCPQWNVMFAKVYSKPTDSISCPLEQFSNCVPSNYTEAGYNYCVLSGKVDCAYISSLSLPANAGAGTGGNGSGGDPTATPTPAGPTATPGSTATPTPTPFAETPTPTPCVKNYSCTGSPLRCNVISPSGSGQYCASNCNGVCP